MRYDKGKTWSFHGDGCSQRSGGRGDLPLQLFLLLGSSKKLGLYGVTKKRRGLYVWQINLSGY